MKTIVLFLLSGILSVHCMGQNVVDVHCHNILPDYLTMLERHDALLDETFPLPDWSLAEHEKFMQQAGIRTSILTMPAPQPYFGDSRESQKVIRGYNEYCARLKAEAPDKFRFCASLPLPDVEAAIREAVYALDTLHADGVKLATNSRGQYLGDAALDTLMHVLNERGAVIIIHPHKPVPVNDEIISTVPLAVYEYPAETTRAILNMLARNVLVRYPRLKIVVPHCGSFLPLAIPRMKVILPAMKAKGLMGDIDIAGNLSRLYYDLAGAASPQTIRSMLTITSPDHILYGSDYPYQPMGVLTENLDRLKKELSQDKGLARYADMFLRENAYKLFNIDIHD